MKSPAFILLLFLLLISAVTPVVAIRENFQNYGTASTWTSTSGTIGPTINSTTGEIQYAFSGSNLINAVAVPYTYAAADSQGAYIYLYDASHNVLSYQSITCNAGSSSTLNNRVEMKVIGGAPTFYCDGALYVTKPQIGVNPSYISFGGLSNNYYTGSIDNIVFGENDNHVVGGLPSNWTILRDFLNSAATGVYAGYNSTTLYPWVGPKSSTTLYLDADTDSTACPGTETFNIANVATGTIVNSTVIDCTVPRHQIAYNLTSLLAAGPSVIPDGEYEAYYTGSTVFGYFYILSQGGSLTMDKSTYNVGDTGQLTWYLSHKYIDLTDFTYTYRITDVYGNAIQSGITVTTAQSGDATGTVPITFTSSKYAQGAYFGQLVATGNSGTPYQGQVLILGNYAFTLTNYLNLYGVVYNGTSCTPLSGAVVNISQGALINNFTSPSDGNYSITGFTTGSPLIFNVTKPGYAQYYYSMTPTTTRNVSVNLNIYPSALSPLGLAIGGEVRDQTYGNPIASRPVWVQNSTTGEYHTVYTNACGYYYCDNSVGCNLVTKRPYSVFGSGVPGWGNSSVYQVVTS